MSTSDDLPSYPSDPGETPPPPQWQAQGQEQRPPEPRAPYGGAPDRPSPSDDERSWAMAAHLGAFVAAYIALGLLAPLVVLLTKGRDSAYVRRHAVESLNFQITALVYAAIGVVLAFVLIGFALLAILAIFYLVVVILGGVKASQGQDYRYPLTFRFVS